MKTELDKLLAETQHIFDAVKRKIYENAHVALHQSKYRESYNELAKRYEVLKIRTDELNEQVCKAQLKKLIYPIF